MARQRTSERWEIKGKDGTPRFGYVEGVQSRVAGQPPRAVLRWCGVPVALGMPFTDDYQQAATKRARTIAREFESGKRPDPRLRHRPGADAPSPASAGVVTYSMARAEFISTQFRLTSGDARRPRAAELLQTRKANYLIALRSCFRDDDFILTDDELYHRVGAWLDAPRGIRVERLNDNTVSGYADMVRTFIDYCIARLWVRLQPFSLLKAPTMTASEGRHYSAEEQAQLMRWVTKKLLRARRARAGSGLRGRSPKGIEQLHDYLRIQGMAGMRSIEAASLRWADYVGDGESVNVVTSEVFVLVDTKWAKKPKRRIFPYRLFPEIAAAVDRQRRYADRNGGFLFPWRDQQAPTRIMKAAFDELHIDRPELSLHTPLRGMAVVYLESRGVPHELATALIGNSPRIYDLHYADRGTITDRIAVVITDVASYVRPGTSSRAASNPRAMALADTGRPQPRVW